MVRSRLALAFPLFAALLACGTALSMKQTELPGGNDSFGKLEAQAQKLGWKTERGDDMSAHGLTTYPKEGEKLFFTVPVNAPGLAFNCEGGTLEDNAACVAAANQLITPVFGVKFEE